MQYPKLGKGLYVVVTEHSAGEETTVNNNTGVDLS